MTPPQFNTTLKFGITPLSINNFISYIHHVKIETKISIAFEGQSCFASVSAWSHFPHTCIYLIPKQKKRKICVKSSQDSYSNKSPTQRKSKTETRWRKRGIKQNSNKNDATQSDTQNVSKLIIIESCFITDLIWFCTTAYHVMREHVSTPTSSQRSVTVSANKIWYSHTNQYSTDCLCGCTL